MKVLFIGNSHTYFNDMPRLFQKMCGEISGVLPDVTMLAYSGRHLEWHTKEYFSVRYNLLYGHYDFCILQQAAHPFPPAEITFEQGTRLIRLCQSVGTVPVLYMTWAEKDKPENQQKMIDVYTELAKRTGARLAPVGTIWQKVRKSHPDIELYWEDGQHASPYGDYLAACTLSAAVTGTTACAVSDEGMDFLKGRKLDFSCASAIECAADVPLMLNHKKCEAIRKTASHILASYDDSNPK